MSINIKVMKQDLTRRMESAMKILRNDFSGLRTGRANPALLESVRVNAYDTILPLNQVSNILVAGPSLLQVQIWDNTLVKAVESAIREANLGLNPQTEGQMIRVPLPQLTAERRNELAKAAARYAEHARVAVRGVRRDAMEQIKAMGKKSELGEDDIKYAEVEIQKLTDLFIKQINTALADKDKDIRTI
jgi:ribosome recycling factor